MFHGFKLFVDRSNANRRVHAIPPQSWEQTDAICIVFNALAKNSDYDQIYVAQKTTTCFTVKALFAFVSAFSTSCYSPNQTILFPRLLFQNQTLLQENAFSLCHTPKKEEEEEEDEAVNILTEDEKLKSFVVFSPDHRNVEARVLEGKIKLAAEEHLVSFLATCEDTVLDRELFMLQFDLTRHTWDDYLKLQVSLGTAWCQVNIELPPARLFYNLVNKLDNVYHLQQVEANSLIWPKQCEDATFKINADTKYFNANKQKLVPPKIIFTHEVISCKVCWDPSKNVFLIRQILFVDLK